MENKLVITESGQQVLVQQGGIMTCTVQYDDDPVVSEHLLDVTDAELEQLRKLASTNSISSGTIQEKALALNETPSMTDTNNGEKA